MNIRTCLCCPVPDHVKTGIGYISLFAIMDAESDEPRLARAKALHIEVVTRPINVMSKISYFIVRTFDAFSHIHK
jgi:hypothetical protein